MMWLMLLLSANAWSADVINNPTMEIRRSVNTPSLSDPPWHVMTPSENALTLANPIRYLKFVGSALVLKTGPEQTAADAAFNTANTANIVGKIMSDRRDYKDIFMYTAANTLSSSLSYSKAQIIAIFVLIEPALNQMDSGLLEAAKATILATSTTATFTTGVRTTMANTIQTQLDSEPL
jgi:hypothetical protein